MSSSEWTTIGEVAVVYDGPHATPKKVSFGPVFLGIASLTSGRLDISASEHIGEDDYTKWTRRVTPSKGDVVFSYETRLGEAAIIPEGLKCCLGRRMGLLRPKTGKILPEYLLYAYLGPDFQGVIRSKTIHGSTVDRISIKDFPSFPIRVPSLKEQRIAVDILKPIDDKIELNRQMNATLEAIAQALFKEWFVDFNYPGASGEMVESELGMIPEGWRVEPFDSVAHFLNGLALQKFPPESETEYLPVIKIRELKNGITENSDKASKQLPAKYIVDDGDLLFSWSGTLEVRFWNGGKGALNQHLFKVTSEKYELWFCYLWLLFHLESFRKTAEDKTTTMGHIQRRHLTEALCLVPESIEVFNKVFKPLIDTIISNEQQNKTLTQLRDSLLPKLMKGEIAI